MDYALKFVGDSDTEIEGLLVPYGGAIGGKDIDGEFFSAKTDLCLEWFPDQTRPLLFHHGMDPEIEAEPIGQIKSIQKTDKGYWIRGWLKKSHAYYEAVKELISEKAGGLSSGSMPHLVKVAKSGEILRWPLVEGSITPCPSNILATVDFATAKAHFKSAGIDVDFDALKAEMDAAERDALSDSDFAYVDSDGNRHLPINDAAHVRNALSRFDQTEFESEAAKNAAKKKIDAAAKKFGIDSDTTKSADVDGLKSIEGSYEDLIEDLACLLNPETPFGPQCYTSIIATYDGSLIACRYDFDADGDEAQTYWKVTYTIGDDGEPTLGAAEQVEQTYVPAKAYTSDSPLTLDGTTLSHHAGAFAQRTEGLHERRIKEGRVLSTANRQTLSDALKTLGAATSALQVLLDASDQLGRDQAEAKALLAPDALQRRIAALSLFVGDEPAP